MIPRKISKRLKHLSTKFPIVFVTGPRQSGKTTLVKSIFHHKPYVSFENLDSREFALRDPRGFLENFPEGAVFDEVQHVPDLFSYLQEVVDDKDQEGLFILTGSQQFLLMEKISQTLAGRAGLLTLLPFSLDEIRGSIKRASLNAILFSGMYPRVKAKKIHPRDWYPVYIQTYIERDVRLIKNITDLNLFQRFLKMCAARTGQLLNLSSLANDCGITHNTAKSWIGVLEASYILYLLPPHYKNFNKRLVKNPKLYFYDTGLVCSLLGIQDAKELEYHSMRGALFETFVLSEFVKARANKGLPFHLFFWRDKTGHEIDCVFEKESNLVAIEVKSAKTLTKDLFKNLNYWLRLSRENSRKTFLIYGGEENQKRQSTSIIGWKSLPSLNKILI